MAYEADKYICPFMGQCIYIEPAKGVIRKVETKGKIAYRCEGLEKVINVDRIEGKIECAIPILLHAIINRINE